MNQIRIGDVVATGRQGRFKFQHAEGNERPICLDKVNIQQLLCFIDAWLTGAFNGRRSFRVPIDRSSGLATALHHGNEVLTVLPRDLSLTGIYVELPSDMVDRLPVGTDVEVALCFEGRVLLLPGAIKRQDGAGRAVLFTERIDGEQLCPPEDLIRAVVEMYRRARKVDIAKADPSGAPQAFPG